jgi:hypothetical protein
MKCIFNSSTIWATLRHHFPGSLDALAAYEERFGTTISRDRIGILDLSKQARPLDIDDEEAFVQALKEEYTLPVIQSASSAWQMPPGAFGQTGCGPS